MGEYGGEMHRERSHRFWHGGRIMYLRVTESERTCCSGLVLRCRLPSSSDEITRFEKPEPCPSFPSGKSRFRARNLDFFQRGRFPPSGFVFQEFCKKCSKSVENPVSCPPRPPRGPSRVARVTSFQSNELETIQNRFAILIFFRDSFN